MMAPAPPAAVLADGGIAAPLKAPAGNAAWRSGDGVIKGTRLSEPALIWLGPIINAAEAAGLAVPRLHAKKGTVPRAPFTVIRE